MIVYLVLQRLAEQALAEVESPEPPLFLVFINLLVNDAIFLLDEALDVSALYQPPHNALLQSYREYLVTD